MGSIGGSGFFFRTEKEHFRGVKAHQEPKFRKRQ